MLTLKQIVTINEMNKNMDIKYWFYYAWKKDVWIEMRNKQRDDMKLAQLKSVSSDND